MTYIIYIYYIYTYIYIYRIHIKFDYMFQRFDHFDPTGRGAQAHGGREGGQGGLRQALGRVPPRAEGAPRRGSGQEKGQEKLRKLWRNDFRNNFAAKLELRLRRKLSLQTWTQLKELSKLQKQGKALQTKQRRVEKSFGVGLCFFDYKSFGYQRHVLVAHIRNIAVQRATIPDQR